MTSDAGYSSDGANPCPCTLLVEPLADGSLPDNVCFETMMTTVPTSTLARIAPAMKP